MRRTVRFAAVALVSLSAFVGSLVAADWPGFRGSRGGVADDKDLPVEWSKDNFLWKVKLPGPGTSSPITTGDKVIVTCYTGYGLSFSKGFGGGGFGKGGFGKGGFGKGGFKKGGFGKGGFGMPGASPEEQKAQAKMRLVVLCLDRGSGQVMWQKEIEPRLPETSHTGMMREHGYASSTPVTDGERVYVFFGKSGVVAFDLTGKQLWHVSVGTNTNRMGMGSGASPVLYKDVLIVNAAIESDSLVGLDKKTGKEIWRVKGLGTSWATPLLVETKDGQQEAVMSLPGRVVGYDPETGKELWRCQGIGSAGGMGYTSSTPVARDGIVYVTGGGGGPTPAATLAVRTGGRGDVDKTHVLWRKRVGTGIASPVLVGDNLCWVSGTAVWLSLKDGATAQKERLYGSLQEYVSTVAAGNKVFALTRFDGLFVLDGTTREKLAHNEFKGDDSIFNASPAISDGRLYIRSNAYLYCIGNKTGK
jgi:outer membrane protein assembly factor BamB